MPSYRRYFALGKFYFLTLVTREREKIFSNSQIIRRFEEALTHCARRFPHRLHAWIYMPDHIHLILEHQDEHTPADLIRCVKRGFLYRIRIESVGFGESDLRVLLERNGTVWQPRYYDHVIRNEEDFARHADYIHFNPVKHGLITNPFDWIYSSIHEYQYGNGWGLAEPATICSLELE